MSISTTTPSNKPEERREKIKKLREHHMPTFERLGVPDAEYIPKLFYHPKDASGNPKEELFLSFFASEIAKLGKMDLYTEDADSDYTARDPERKLYKLRCNPHYEEEYEKTDPSAGPLRYLVPAGELVEIKADTEPEKPFVLPDSDTDLPMDQMTIRDLAAILLKKPVSRKEWLNQIITKS
jgi:hypothetical protein